MKTIPPLDPKWHVVYTRARTEKRVAARMNRNGIECYLPLQKVLKQWSDRKKWVWEPLFRSYLFVRIVPKQYQEVVSDPGVVRFIYFEGKPATVSEEQIEHLRRLIANEIPLERTSPLLKIGQRVRVISGPMLGIEGILHNFQGTRRILIQINGIDQALAIMLPSADVEPVR
jgi:transcriptional antiterminator RfaH